MLAAVKTGQSECGPHPRAGYCPLSSYHHQVLGPEKTRWKTGLGAECGSAFTGHQTNQDTLLLVHLSGYFNKSQKNPTFQLVHLNHQIKEQNWSSVNTIKSQNKPRNLVTSSLK